MLKIIFIGIFCLFFFPNFVFGQEEEHVEQAMALKDLDPLDEDFDFSMQLEKLSHLKSNPIDLNKANSAELSQLFFLSAQQIQEFLKHREKSGDFKSVHELQSIKSFDLATVSLMIPYVQVKAKLDWRWSHFKPVGSDQWGWVMGTYARVMNRQLGYTMQDSNRNRYLGSPDRIAIRYRWANNRKIQVHLNMEKDPGEPFFREAQKFGFDYYSASLTYRDPKKSRVIILGDYHVQLGQGLLVWTGPQFGNRFSISPMLLQQEGIRPHTGFMESKFFRGLATSWRLNHWSILPFISYRKQTGTTELIEEQGTVLRSINHSGLHRTPSELRNRHSTGLFNAGLQVAYQLADLNLGISYLWSQLTYPLQPKNTYFNPLRFRGNRLQQVSLHYQYAFSGIQFFGEVAHSLKAGWANYHAVTSGLGKAFSISFRFRDYQTNYHQLFAHAFQSQSNLGNEKGYTATFAFHPSRQINWINHVDFVQYPSPKYLAFLPSTKLLLQSQIAYHWYKKGFLKFRFQHQTYQENYPAKSKIKDALAQVDRMQFRLNFQYQLSKVWAIANQAEFKWYGKDREYPSRGYLFYQDIIWKSPNRICSANLRLAWFHIDSYAARVFVYERDVLYSFSFPAYFRKGIRAYINQKWRIGNRLEFWLKYAISIYRNVGEIGSGLDRIVGNHKSDIRFQIRYTWK